MSHAVIYDPPEPAWVRLQREEQEREQVSRRCADLRAEATVVVEELREHAVTGDGSLELPAVPGADATVDELRTAAGTLERRCEELHRQLGEARTGSLVASLRDGLRSSSTSASGRGGSLPPSWREPAAAAEPVAAWGDAQADVGDDAGNGAEDVSGDAGSRQPAAPDEATVRRILGRLDPDVSDRERAAAAQLAEQLLDAAEDPYAGRWVSQLRELVARSSAEAQQRRRDRRRAREALGQVEEAELDPALARSLRAAAAGEQPWSSELQSAVERVVADRERTAVRQQVAAAVGEVFEELGYDVQAHPDPDDADTRRAFVRRDWGPYAVAAEVDDKQRVQLCLVRTDADSVDPVRDREVEERFCDGLDDVGDGLARRGLGIRPERVFDSTGQGLPVNPQLAADEASEARSSRSTHRREMGRG